MRRFKGVSLLVATAFATVLLALPAAAADTNTTFSVNGGQLSITVPASKTLSSVTTGGQTASSNLGTVTVTDERGANNGSWTASVGSTNFTTGGATPAETVPNANVSYWSGTATSTTGSATFTPGQSTPPSAVTLQFQRTAFSASNVVGNNTANWDPNLSVATSSSNVAGTYSGTISHSVA
jgi:hypothetical protein